VKIDPRLRYSIKTQQGPYGLGIVFDEKQKIDQQDITQNIVTS
jgi:hypothetical protein